MPSSTRATWTRSSTSDIGSIFSINTAKMFILRETKKSTAIYGFTETSDLTEEEFFREYKGMDTSLYSEQLEEIEIEDLPQNDLPKELDCRLKKAVTKVKNQGLCGSCWAFSVTGNIEGQHAIKSGQLLSLSEQELVDCDKLDQGCNGGLPENAYKAVVKLGGLETESEYKIKDAMCRINGTLATRIKVLKNEFSDVPSHFRIKGSRRLKNDEGFLQQWLFKNGPISVGINAMAMQFYMGGISHPWHFLCGAGNIDHGVLLVGFGVHVYPHFFRPQPFWIVKNSWGQNWGEQGYYRLYRGDNTCGIAQMASTAIL